MSKKYVSPYLFFFFDKSGIALWDYMANQSWILESPYLDRLVTLAYDPANSDAAAAAIDAELLASGVVSDEPFPMLDWGWSKLAEIYHFGTKNFGQVLSLDNESSYVRTYIDLCAGVYDGVKEEDLRVRREGDAVDLPAPNLEPLRQVSLVDALYKRKTTRTFFGTPISLEQLSTVLYLAFGEIHGRWDLETRGLRSLAIRKAAPSGGGMHACNAYVVAMNIDGLPQGVYHYESDTHQLRRVSEADYRDSIGRLVCGQQFAKKLSAGIFITCAFDKVWVKYKHSRAYRVPFIDAGHVSQNFHLVVNALGLNSWLSGVFRDDEVSAALEIDPISPEQPIFFVGLGNGNGDYLHPEIIDAIDERLREGDQQVATVEAP